jgi:hypothetical protein
MASALGISGLRARAKINSDFPVGGRSLLEVSHSFGIAVLSAAFVGVPPGNIHN